MKNFSACDKIVSKMAKTESTPVEKLFGSKTRAKLLRLFFESPSKSYYVREITRVIDEQINSVRRELLNLEGIGVIKSETYDNKVYYSANQKHPFSKPLNEMFNIIIDCGHGGSDSGAIGVNGLKEKDYNLLIGEKVINYLKNYDVKILYSQDGL